MARILCIAFFLFPVFAWSQRTLEGIVHGEKGEALAGASIFLSNTSVGTTTNGQGTFLLTLPPGKYDLVVSYLGYETHTQVVEASPLPQRLTIRLKPKAQELEAVVIVPYEKKGWEKWGKFFIEYFLGTTPLAEYCTIRNPEVIRFRNSKRDNELTATATAPLIIENKALGYTVRYQLEEFRFSFRSRHLFYSGFPFFEPMQGGAARQRKWEAERSRAYHGSIMHFMRSLYRNKLAENDFTLYPLKKVPNREKARIKAKMKAAFEAHGPKESSAMYRDSSGYYDRFLAQPDVQDIIGKAKLPADSIAYAADSTTAGLYFQDYLYIMYTGASGRPEYKEQFPKSDGSMSSEVTLIYNRPIEVEANGMFFMPTNLLASGYWGWSEKISSMLPFDYEPPPRVSWER